MKIFVKYLYIIVIIGLVIVLAIFIKELIGFLKKLSKIDTTKLTKNVETINNKVNDIEETKKSWKFFLKIYIISSIIKEIFEDLKKGSKKVVAASIAKTAIKNVGKIKNI